MAANSVDHIAYGTRFPSWSRALDFAEPDGVLLWFMLHPVPGLLERHTRHRTAHAALIAEILSLLAGRTSSPPPRCSRACPPVITPGARSRAAWAVRCRA